MTDYHVVKRGDKPKPKQPEPKNLLTSVPKKGSYGFVNLGISGDYKRGNVVDDYDIARKNARKEREENKKKLKGGAFVAGSSFRKPYFGENPYSAPSKMPPVSKKKAAADSAKSKTIAVPFKPSSKRDPSIGSILPYISDPYDKNEKKPLKKDRAPSPVW
eukprot:CAMPEP_0117424916 /NCGR_PEP_ID=MMETSP0758-20121206/5265_1 /TAXON_ID=63605 /ORGANISM="Percolomonas cosmopolitus, Strain AE-1 (ATCC 50343)" /LENGTH=159 /DNA_ID=CAMNT_0005209033 /DNA_START=396 /DNA_END=872 /DNA_ORIENTATION=-